MGKNNSHLVFKALHSLILVLQSKPKKYAKSLVAHQISWPQNYCKKNPTDHNSLISGPVELSYIYYYLEIIQSKVK